MTTHVNKVHHVTTITQVAKDLGEDEDWLRDIAIEMEIEDGVIWSMVSEKMAFRRSPTSESKPDRARSDVQRKSDLAQALAARIIQSACGLRRMRTLFC